MPSGLRAELRLMSSARSISAADVMGLDTGTSTLAAVADVSSSSGRSRSILILIFEAACEATIGAMAQVTRITSTVPLSIVSSMMRVPSGRIIL